MKSEYQITPFRRPFSFALRETDKMKQLNNDLILMYSKPRIYQIAGDRNFHAIHTKSDISHISMNFPLSNVSDIFELYISEVYREFVTRRSVLRFGCRFPQGDSKWPPNRSAARAEGTENVADRREAVTVLSLTSSCQLRCFLSKRGGGHTLGTSRDFGLGISYPNPSKRIRLQTPRFGS